MPDDPNAAQFKAGAHSVLDDSGLNILAEYDNPDWSPDNAQKFTTDQLDKIDDPPSWPASTPPTTARPAASSPR